MLLIPIWRLIVLAVRSGRFFLLVSLFSACFTFRVGFYQRCFTRFVEFRWSLNSKDFIKKTLYYKKSFLSLQRLRIAGNLRKTRERKAKG